MNERVPDSSGLPLRAMVMVLLFLGVIFLLVGFQAMSTGTDTADDTSALTVTTTTTTMNLVGSKNTFFRRITRSSGFSMVCLVS